MSVPEQVAGKGSSHLIYQDQGADPAYTQFQQPLPRYHALLCVSSRVEVELLLRVRSWAWTKEHTKNLKT